jgi:NTE family protein
MAKPAKTNLPRQQSRPPFDCIALLLQGGGALGAYQAGVYEALAEANLHPDWTAGISIGAINSALIAGNPPESRVEKLREFWQQITTPLPLLNHAPQMAMAAEPTARPDAWQGTYAAKMWEFWERVGSTAVSSGLHGLEQQTVKGDAARGLFNKLSASRVLMTGAAGFFTPRLPVPWLYPDGSLEASAIGMAASSPTRHWNGLSKASRTGTRWPSRSISGVRAANSRATCRR